MAWRLRRGRLPDAGGVHLRRHRGAPGLGTVLPGAGRADQRRRRRPHQPRGRHRPHRGGEVMILVAGGTGTLGTRLVRLLSDRGVEVRVLTRDPARAAHLPHTVQILTGDLREPAAVAAAVRGCSTVVSAVHGFVGPGKPSPESIDRDANLALIQAAATAGVEHLVLVSGLGVAADHPMSLYRAKFAAEQALRASGLRWTIIRPSAYLETWIGVTGAKLAGKGQALVFGPENLTFTQIADQLIAAGGRPGRTRHIPLPMLRAMSVLARPAAPSFARQAQAAVMMNTADMTVDVSAIRDRLPTVPATPLHDLLTRQPSPQVPPADARPPR